MQAEWDDRYAEQEQLWSGRPNGALVAEVAGLTPGRVLDVGHHDELLERSGVYQRLFASWRSQTALA